jgi:hypothetical protein
MAFAMGYYHWFWLAQPRDRPERMILRDVEDWFDLHTAREPKDKSFFHPEARADYLAALHLPDTVMGICEDYRAATGIDLVHDRESRANGVKVQCPLLALWGAKGALPPADAAQVHPLTQRFAHFKASVLMLQSCLSCSKSAAALMASGSIIGSSPCTFTTMTASFKSKISQASAKRSLPEGWS